MACFGFNDRPLIGNHSGVGRYVAEVLSHWPTEGCSPPRGVIATCTGGRWPREEPAFEFPSVERVERVRLRPLREVAERRASARREPLGTRLSRPALQRGFSAISRAVAHRAALFWEPDHIPRCRARRLVTTVHDLSVIDRPRDHPAHRVARWERHFRERLAWSDAFVCVSHATAAALRPWLQEGGIEPSRARVIHLGPRWPTPPGEWTGEAMRQRLGLPERAIVCLGTIEPRKNHRILLDAMGELDEPERASIALIFAGKAGWGGAEFWRSLARHPMSERVLATGHVTDAQAAALLVGSAGFVYPSVYEGFGLPVLEAMRLGVPTAVSTASALREVAGGASIELDPLDAEAWAGALMRLVEDGPGRCELARRGVARAEQFSWDRCAREHARLFAELLDGA